MGVIAFGRPQEGLEYYKNVLDLIRVMQDILQNSDGASTTIDKLSKQLQLELTLSEDRKLEAVAAQEVIAQSKEAQEDLREAKAEHAARVKMELADLDKKYEAYQRSVDEMNAEKINNKKIMEKTSSDAFSALAQAQKLSAEAALRNNKAESVEKAMAAKQLEHEANLANFQEAKATHAQEIMIKHAEIDDKTANLEQNIKAFELRKKKFEDALKA